MIYLDNSATTKPCKTAVEAINNALCENWGNPSSTYSHGISALEIIEDSRKTVANFIGAKPDEIFFTGSGTEANNLAIFGCVNALKKKGKKIVSTAIEHPSVLEALKKLKDDGYEIVLLSPNENGQIKEEDLRKEIDGNTILVSIMLVNNEIGSVEPIEMASKIIKEKNSPALLHCDAVQGFGKLPIKVSNLGVDLMSASGHKIHASKGIGFLYKKSGINIHPVIYGGGQEKGLRSGTEAAPLIAGLGAAVKALPDPNKQLTLQQEFYLKAKEILSEVKAIKFNSPDNALPYILNISIDGYKSEPMLNALALENIYVSKGSACAKGHRSYVLSEIGLSNDRIDSAIRISFSRENTLEEIETLKNAILKITEKMRRFKK
ncbi:MAG: cysteine desulfurase [Ruminococcaceae bacterium]|nr:cysteine desulfurase [Oscillospiraceae bacterium]